MQEQNVIPVNLAPIYAITELSKKKMKHQPVVSTNNTLALIISIITKYAEDSFVNLPDNRFVSMENEISAILTDFKKDVEKELECK